MSVARVMWKPMPNLAVSAEAWILVGCAHHTVLSCGCDAEMIWDWARIMEIEIAGEYAKVTVTVIIERFAGLSPADVPAVLVHSYSPFAWDMDTYVPLNGAICLE